MTSRRLLFFSLLCSIWYVYCAQSNLRMLDYSLRYNLNGVPEHLAIRLNFSFDRDTIVNVYIKEGDYKAVKQCGSAWPLLNSMVDWHVGWRIDTHAGDSLFSMHYGYSCKDIAKVVRRKIRMGKNGIVCHFDPNLNSVHSWFVQSNRIKTNARFSTLTLLLSRYGGKETGERSGFITTETYVISLRSQE